MLGFSHPEDFCLNLFLQSYIYILLFTTRVGCFTVNWIFFAFNWFFVKIVPWLDTTLTGKIILSFPRSVSLWSNNWNSAQWKSSYNHNQTDYNVPSKIKRENCELYLTNCCVIRIIGMCVKTLVDQILKEWLPLGWRSTFVNYLRVLQLK